MITHQNCFPKNENLLKSSLFPFDLSDPGKWAYDEMI